MENKYILKRDYPASWWKEMWRDAMPAGNGELGAAVYGGVHLETVLLTHSRLWWKAKTLQLPNISESLQRTRDLLLENKPFEADKILQQCFQEAGYDPSIGLPLPLCDLLLEMETKKAFSQYERVLDMESGEIRVSWSDDDRRYHRKLVVSRPDDLIAFYISEEKSLKFSGEMRLDYHDLADIPPYVTDIEAYLPKVQEQKYEDGFLTFVAQKDDGECYGCVAKVLSKDGAIFEKEKGLSFSDTSELLVLIKLFVGDISQSEKLKKELSEIRYDYAQLLERNREIHGKLLTATELELYPDTAQTSNELLLHATYQDKMPHEMIEKMWGYARYLLISSSKKEGLPCHLYGLWCGSYEGIWAFNMANENLQMIYWQALSGNMPDLLLAVFDYIDTMMEDFKVNAKNIYGCRGIYIPAPSTPESGLLKVLLPHIIHFTAAAGWIAQHYYDYFSFTQDREFLEKRAMPFMEQVALFYEDYLIEDEHGKLMILPSNSPENTPGNYWDGKEGMGAIMETTINATIDIAVIKEVLTHLIEGNRIVGGYDNKIITWQKMLEKLPEYEINEDGAIKEWIHPYYKDNYRHRHQSHIYPMFPGNEIRQETHPELYDACVIAINKRLVIGLNQQSGWSLAHMANVYARMKEGELALECLNHMAKSCVVPNFFTLHNDWRNMGIGVKRPEHAPVQLDANMGFASAINELLVQSFEDYILILPALPKDFSKGKVSNLLVRGNIEVSISWDAEQKQAKTRMCAKTINLKRHIIVPTDVVRVDGYEVENGMIKDVRLIVGKVVEIVLDLK